MRIAGFEVIVTEAVPPDGLYIQRGPTEVAFNGERIITTRHVRKVLDLAARSEEKKT